MKRIKEEVIISRKVFFNEESMFGIYGCKPTKRKSELQLNKFYNISIQGNSRELREDKKYTVLLEGVYTHEKYGEYYKIVNVEADKLNTIEEQDAFLTSVISNKQFKVLKKAYPNHKIVDLIMNDEVDISRTKGIKEKTLEKIKDKVKSHAHLSRLLVELDKLELSTLRLERISSHFGNVDKAIDVIHNDIYRLCEIKQFGFTTVDEAAMRRGDNPMSKGRVKACLSYLLVEDNQKGHSYSILGDILNTLTSMLDIPSDFIGKVMREFKDEGSFYFKGDLVAFNHVFDTEKQILSELLRIHNSYNPPNLNRIKENLKNIQEELPFELTDEQYDAIVKSSQNGVCVINGGGGSGKSSIVDASLKAISKNDEEVYYMTCALSGKAANVLEQKGVSSSTIHRMLGWSVKENCFLHNEHLNLSYDVVVIDEASMVNANLFLSVVKSIKRGAKVIIVGDSGQLVGIGVGDVLRDLIQTNLFPRYELTKIHRQAEKSGILSLANRIRRGENIARYNYTGKETYGELKDQDVYFYSDKSSIPSDVAKIANMFKSKINKPEDLLDFQVLVANKERGDLCVRKLNTALQEILNDDEGEFIKHNSYQYRTGDKVITQGNKYECTILKEDEEVEGNVYNGTLGIIKKVNQREGKLIIQFEGIEGLVEFSEGDLFNLDMAYAITVHKSQGSAFKYLVVAVDFGAYSLLSRQLIYTALTRASEKGIMLCESNALHKALNHDESGSRRTFLKELIEKEISSRA